jgi:predicted RNase H-like HicB family nuclease
LGEYAATSALSLGSQRKMEKLRFVYWQNEDMWLGYLEDYPDYMTQGETLKELGENLKDIYNELISGSIPCVRKVAELEVA